MAKNLVIVESPAKAHTIEKYLGPDFRVLASVGHIRKDTKVDKNTFDVTYEIDPEHKKVISELKKAVKTADKIWLATDEDREGESIAWHLCEVLKLPEDTARIVFHEITKPALENAISHPRTVDMDMVMSQQARQTLDMLVGFDLSDLVRKKVPGAISAGRVQSPALRLLVEREREIDQFKSAFSFKISGDFAPQGPKNTKSTTFTATYDGDAPVDKKTATELLESLSSADFVVSDVSKSDGTKANPIPLTTAALQIEASSKLGFSARTTMSAAQGLYQAGLITYHRTDSLNLSTQAIAAMSAYIEQHFGHHYLHTRHFHTKDASAQEAHEAIRPTDVTRTSAGKNNYEKRLYQLIWSRTLATQMANAKVAKTTIKLEPTKTSATKTQATEITKTQTAKGTKTQTTQSRTAQTFTAKGEIVIFDGFLRVYGKAKDLELPELQIGDPLTCKELTAHQTFAKPPARYTEGSLVKKLEELGIGRPSTYASIMTAIQARGYAIKGESEGEERDAIELKAKNGQVSREILQEKTGANKGKLIPTPVGELVADFLTDNFQNIVDYQFTANIEQDLDRIAEAKLDRVKMLRDFYSPFSQTVGSAAKAERYNNAHLLGTDPKTKLPIYAKIGKNGGFIQLGANEKESGQKPRFAPLPSGKTVKTVTLAEALDQLALPALPRTLGRAKDGTEIIAASGPFGPYLKAGKYNIPMKDLDPYTVTLAEALPLYQAKIDSIIADWGDLMIIRGAYGPYIKGPGRRNNLKIPKELDPAKISEAEARQMLAEKPKTTRRGTRGSGRKISKKSTKTTRKSSKTAKK